MNSKTLEELMFGKKYCSPKDLRFNTKDGYLFSQSQLREFKDEKDKLIGENVPFTVKLPLKSFNSKHIFYVTGEYLLALVNDYLDTVIKDFQANNKFLNVRQADNLIKSRIFSEIEGTLSIENVPTTTKRIREVCGNGNLTDKNDIIIKNMSLAMNYIIKEKPQFNKENLHKLYCLLSDNCLDKDKELNGGYYRDGAVYIGDYDGAPHDKIDELMNSLFDFVNGFMSGNYVKDVKKFYLPHICHYYILYVHPYFDYNGRTARMVSFWISYITDYYCSPLFISEAINENRGEYYSALSDTRDMNNDLTYFLGYAFKTAVKFSMIYKNVEEVEKTLAKSGNFLTANESMYFKKILIHNSDGYFNSKLFISYINNDISKQGAANMLNQLTDYGLLTATVNKKKEKIYRVNQEFITYKLS